MPWPLSQDYNEAIQSPDSTLGDAELRGGQPATNALGIPIPRSGNFADVYEFTGSRGTRYALKCFTRHVSGLRERYIEIGKHLAQAKLPFMVDFEFQLRGMRIRGDWYPVLKMQWVEGQLLNEFVRGHLDHPVMLDKLANLWVRMAKALGDAGLAHADLQHGNVLLVPGSRADSLALKVIDYDGMWVPALANKKPEEVGHPNYQHPQRARESAYCAELDRVPLLVVACALRGLAVGGKALWDRYDNGDNLLFREADLQNPKDSALFRDLWKLNDPAVHALTGYLAIGLTARLEYGPHLQNLVSNDGIRPLSTAQANYVVTLLGPGPAALHRPPVTAPRTPAPPSRFGSAPASEAKKTPPAPRPYRRGWVGAALRAILTLPLRRIPIWAAVLTAAGAVCLSAAATAYLTWVWQPADGPQTPPGDNQVSPAVVVEPPATAPPESGAPALRFIEVPKNVRAGKLPPIVIGVRDANGSELGYDVTLKLKRGEQFVISTLDGRDYHREPAANGKARFEHVYITEPGQNYILVVTAGKQTIEYPSKLHVEPGPADNLRIKLPDRNPIAGVPFKVQIEAYDKWHNLTTADVVVAAPGLSKPRTLRAEGGEATADLRIKEAGPNYTITAKVDAGDGKAIVQQQKFAIDAGPTARLIPEVGSEVVVAGRKFSVWVTVEDANGNPAQEDIMLNGNKLSGGETTPTTRGVAKFARLVLKSAGKIKLTATAKSDNKIIKDFDVEVKPAPARALTFLEKPGPITATAGKPLAPPLIVEAKDQYGNPAEDPITLTVKRAKLRDPILKGTTEVVPAKGQARFDKVKITKAGKKRYFLRAVAPEATEPADAEVEITINPAAPGKLVFDKEPEAVYATDRLSPVVVKIQDEFENDISDISGEIVTVRLMRRMRGGGVWERVPDKREDPWKRAGNGVAHFKDPIDRNPGRKGTYIWRAFLGDPEKPKAKGDSKPFEVTVKGAAQAHVGPKGDKLQTGARPMRAQDDRWRLSCPAPAHGLLLGVHWAQERWSRP